MYSVRKTKAEFVAQSRAKHGDKFDYSKVEYKSNNEKVCIICPEHGEFWQNPYSHCRRGIGCSKCSQATKKRTNPPLENRLSQFREMHGEKYDYSRIKSIPNAHTKLEILCRACGGESFYMSVNTHLAGAGCRVCGYKKAARSSTLTQEQFVERARHIHGDKYCYQRSVYKKANEPVSVWCKDCQVDFKVPPNSHINARVGCPHCRGRSGFNKELPGVLYYLRAQDEKTDKLIFKIGITNNSARVRFGSRLKGESFYEHRYDHGTDAKKAERLLLDMFAEFRIHSDHFGKKNGNTEWFNRDVLGLFTHDPPLFGMEVEMLCNEYCHDGEQ